MKVAAELARDLVRKAGEVALSMQGKVSVRDKGDSQGPVTDADYASEKILVEGIHAVFPDDEVLSEETRPTVDENAHRIWCVDPVDGTREYAAGLGEWAVMVGLLVDGHPAAGALAVPAEGRVFWGWADGGAFSDDGPIALEPDGPLEDAVAIHSRSHAQGIQQALAKLGITKSIRAGGAGYKVAQLLLGNARLYVHVRHGTSWWDSVAPAAIMKGAGGYAGNGAGGPLVYANGVDHPYGLLFAAPGLGESAAERLRA